MSAALPLHLSGKSCEAFINDIKILMESGSDSFFSYPDVKAACEPGENRDY